MLDVKVRRITAGDAMALKEIRLASLLDAPAAFASRYETNIKRSDDEWHERAKAGASGVEQATFFVENGDEIVAMVGAYVEEEATQAIELVSMWVAPHFRGQGAGQLLIEAVRNWASAAGRASISLWVIHGNDHAQELYKRAGFVATGDIQPVPSNESVDESRMTLSLN